MTDRRKDRMAKKSERFRIIYSQGIAPQYKIAVDTATGVNYIIYTEGYSGGLTVLLDKDGKPVVTPELIDDTIGFSVEK